MSRFPERKVLMITLAVTVLFLSVSASAAMEEMLFHGWSREEMVEMAGYGEEDLSTVLVTGSVVCEAYLHDDGRQLQAWPVSGALVAVECRTKEIGDGPVQTRGITDEDGNFVVNLPPELHSVADLPRKCCVQLLRMPHGSSCKPAEVRKHKRISVLSGTRGVRTYEAENIRLLHSASHRPQASVKQEEGEMDGLL